MAEKKSTPRKATTVRVGSKTAPETRAMKPVPSAPVAPAPAPAPAPKPAAKPAPAPVAAPITISQSERQRMIEEAAYFRAERINFTGDPDEHWAAAEREVDSRLEREKIRVI